jgi:nitrite reductase/ring-hydroxylating ferredoxin subunit
MMRILFTFILYILLIPLLSSCGDAVKDDFPKRQFVGYFNLNSPEYSQQVFSAKHDRQGSYVGVNGIVVYNSGGTYYAFDLMCPHEKSTSCSLKIFPEDDPTIAECECCGSRFLLASPTGEVVEGPAGQGLHSYSTGVTKDNILIVTSN